MSGLEIAWVGVGKMAVVFVLIFINSLEASPLDKKVTTYVIQSRQDRGGVSLIYGCSTGKAQGPCVDTPGLCTSQGGNFVGYCYVEGKYEGVCCTGLDPSSATLTTNPIVQNDTTTTKRPFPGFPTLSTTTTTTSTTTPSSAPSDNSSTTTTTTTKKPFPGLPSLTTPPPNNATNATRPAFPTVPTTTTPVPGDNSTTTNSTQRPFPTFPSMTTTSPNDNSTTNRTFPTMPTMSTPNMTMTTQERPNMTLTVPTTTTTTTEAATNATEQTTAATSPSSEETTTSASSPSEEVTIEQTTTTEATSPSEQTTSESTSSSPSEVTIEQTTTTEASSPSEETTTVITVAPPSEEPSTEETTTTTSEATPSEEVTIEQTSPTTEALSPSEETTTVITVAPPSVEPSTEAPPQESSPAFDVAPADPMGCTPIISEIQSFFTNPSFPSYDSDSDIYQFSVMPQEGYCGLNVLFLDALFARKGSDGCSVDSVIILGNNDDIPSTPLCGSLKGFTTNLRTSPGTPVKLAVTVQSHAHLWRVKLTQIECAGLRHQKIDNNFE